LTAALELDELSFEVTLYEAASRLGGKIRTMDFAGGYVEAGPDSFLAREGWVEDLCRKVGLEDDLVQPALFGGAVWVSGRPRPFPEQALWGMPASARAALGADALTWPERLRALGDLITPGQLKGDDVSVAEFVSRRFGRGVLEHLVDPLLAGTRAGSTKDMSLAGALPQIDAMARSNRSLMRAASAQRAVGQAPSFFSLTGGMQRLSDALETSLTKRVAMQKNKSVDSVGRDGARLEITTADGSAHFDAAVVCVPAPTAAGLLEGAAPEAAKLLGEIEYSPSVSVALRYPSGSVNPPEGTSGVLVPSDQGLTVSGCTWWSTKWPDATSNDDVIRCFVGRATETSLDDDELADACARDVAAITKTTASPLERQVTRWEHGLPRYRVGHLDRLAAIERSLPDGVFLAGAGYRGSGLPDCVKQAHEAVARVAEHTQPH
jgi:oxygen-dependent protoporphyrinogen oxidase